MGFGQLCIQSRGRRLHAWGHAFIFFLQMLFESKTFQTYRSNLGSPKRITIVSHFLLLRCSVAACWVSDTYDHDVLLCLKSALGSSTLLNLGLTPLKCSLSMGSPCSSTAPSHELRSLSNNPPTCSHPPPTAGQRPWPVSFQKKMP